jgi:hypothetical protein
MPMKQLAAVAFSIGALSLTSCDTISGSSRTVTGSRLPSASTVVAALKSTPGVQRVSQHEVPASTSWGLYEGVIHSPAFNQFTFNTATAGGTIETAQDSKGAMTLRIYCMWINYTPPKAQFDATRALLDAAYINLRRADPSLPPPSELKETLVRYPSK